MILMYHNIGAAAGFNTVATAQFHAQLSWLRDAKFEVITLDAYVALAKAGGALGGKVAITFDDAYTSFQALALPILAEFQFPATLFVPVDHVGGANVWDDGKLVIMDWDALRATAASPLVTMGSHGAAHKHMRDLTTEQIAVEATESKRILESQLGRPIHHFSYPFGQLRDFDSRCERAVQAAGYASACATIWGRTQSAKTIFALRRIEIEPQDDLKRFSAKISRPFHPKYLKQRVKNLLYRLHLRR